MPTNQTPNYGLSQWVKSDKVQMEDFNADNAKLDAALKAETDARTALASVVNQTLPKKGNCQISTYSYKGTGVHGEATPTVIPFPKGTFLVLILSTRGDFYGLIPGMSGISWSEGSSGTFSSPITWTETGLSIYSARRELYQFNSRNVDYIAVAFQKAGET